MRFPLPIAAAALALCGVLLVADFALSAEPWPQVASVDRQPLLAQVRRLQDALEHIGSPLSPTTIAALRSLANESDDGKVCQRVQELLDSHCLAAVTLSAEGPPLVVAQSGPAELVAQGWRAFLIKVVNPVEAKARLRLESAAAKPLPHAPVSEVESRWLGLEMFDGPPLSPTLSGLPLEYRLVEIFSNSPGERVAKLDFSAERDAAKAPANDQPRSTAAVVQAWKFDKDPAGWKADNDCRATVQNGSLWVEATGVDPFLTASIAQPPKPGKFVLRFWAKSEESGVGQVFWWTEERPQPDGRHSASFNVEAGRDQLYEIPFQDNGHLTGVRLDTLSKPNKFRIDWVELAYAGTGSDWASIEIPFQTVAAQKVKFSVVDEADRPAMACFEITDSHNRVYPPQSKRLAPDFFFQRQIYRGNGEEIQLPAGKYQVKCSRGPESIPDTKVLVVGKKPVTLEYQVKHWIDPSRRGYWSGDHHIHSAGCAHYENPTKGVFPPDMLRHCMGEDLKVGCCLTWGPCFDFQKSFFTGKPDDISQYPYLIRYDVEVSGFGSHVGGHLNLLRLTEQIPPGGDSKDHWPTLGMNTLRWAKRQGAICGPAHSANGLQRYVDRVPNSEKEDGPNNLPNFFIPAYDGIGANEFIVQVTHEVPGPADTLVPAVDFISTMDTDRTAELNMWYHILNCGFRTRASGETDFPCLSGERVGLGRVYAKLDGKLEFNAWCDAVAAGRSYVSNGKTHLMNFTAHLDTELARELKQPAHLEIGKHNSEVKLAKPGKLSLSVLAAAIQPDHLLLPIELIVNGFPVEEKLLVSDGTARTLTFETEITQSSWVAIRAFPSAHTNPLFVLVDDQPIRASELSAQWCLLGVEQCWKMKENSYRADERPQAAQDYDHARRVYERIIKESQGK